MTRYLMFSWVSFVIFVALLVIKRFIKNKRAKDLYERIAGFFLILMIFLFGIALATNDPVTSIISVPFQLLITATAGAFALWKYYFDPIKERLVRAEKDIILLNSEMRANFSSIRESFSTMKEDFSTMKEDLRMIKGAVFQKK